MKRATRLLQIVLSVLLTMAACGVVAAFVDLRAVARTIAGADLWFAALSIATYLAFQALKTVRLRYIMHSRQPGGVLFVAVVLQGAANSVLPAGVGEIVLIWLLRQVAGAQWGKGLAVVLLSRLADAIVLASAALVALLALGVVLPPFFLYAAVALLAAAGAAILLLGWLVRLDLFRTDEKEVGAWRRILRVQGRVLLRSVRRAGGPSYLAVLCGLTALVWLARFVCHWTTILSLGLPLTFLQIVMVYLVSFSISLVPIRTLGNIGPFEGIWVLVLVPLGIAPLQALEVSVAAHFGILLVTILSTGGVTLLWAAKLLGRSTWRKDRNDSARMRPAHGPHVSQLRGG
jgi:uncharacterized membrane protein YbhN (UPF0104 family)